MDRETGKERRREDTSPRGGGPAPDGAGMRRGAWGRSGRGIPDGRWQIPEGGRELGEDAWGLPLLEPLSSGDWELPSRIAAYIGTFSDRTKWLSRVLALRAAARASAWALSG